LNVITVLDYFDELFRVKDGSIDGIVLSCNISNQRRPPRLWLCSLFCWVCTWS